MDSPNQWKATLCHEPDDQILSIVGVAFEIDDTGKYHIKIPYNFVDRHDHEG